MNAKRRIQLAITFGRNAPRPAGAVLTAIAFVLILAGVADPRIGRVINDRIALQAGVDCRKSAAPDQPLRRNRGEQSAGVATKAIALGRVGDDTGSGSVRLCQAMCPMPMDAPVMVFPQVFEGVDCSQCPGPKEATWHARRPIPWQVFAQGEYVGPYREPHVNEYRLRVDDLLEFIYRLTRVQSSEPYKFQVGDRLEVESLVDQDLNRELVVQPDGTITLRLLGQVIAAGQTVRELKETLEQGYTKFYNIPDITLTPIQINTKLEDLRSAVDRRGGVGGQSMEARVTPEGTIQLTAIGSFPAQVLTLEELKREVDERYAEVVDGIEVMPVLVARAPRFVYLVGEVGAPGRFELTGPTTIMQAIALAGGWNVGANLRQVVVFRRAEDWRLLATRLDLRGALYGKRPCPADEIWVRDSDVVLVPKSPVLVIDDQIELLFTRGFYGVLPFFGADNDFPNLSTIN